MLRHPIKIESANPLARKLAKAINQRVARAPFDYQRIDYADLARETNASVDEIASVLEPIGGEHDGVNIAR